MRVDRGHQRQVELLELVQLGPPRPALLCDRDRHLLHGEVSAELTHGDGEFPTTRSRWSEALRLSLDNTSRLRLEGLSLSGRHLTHTLPLQRPPHLLQGDRLAEDGWAWGQGGVLGLAEVVQKFTISYHPSLPTCLHWPNCWNRLDWLNSLDRLDNMDMLNSLDGLYSRLNILDMVNSLDLWNIVDRLDNLEMLNIRDGLYSRLCSLDMVNSLDMLDVLYRRLDNLERLNILDGLYSRLKSLDLLEIVDSNDLLRNLAGLS